VHGKDGVDITLIQWMLSLTPAERLDALQDFVNAVEEARQAPAGRRDEETHCDAPED
jgi:hypothetical protein